MRSLVCFLVGLIVLGTLGVTLASATQNPTPFVNQPLIPASVAPGGAGFTLTVNGTGFVSGSVVNWNGSARATTFVSGSQLNASILSSDIATANTGSVTVSSPAPGGGVSNVVFLPVRVPATFVSLNTTSFGTGASTFAPAVADFNKDGKQDMAVLIEGLSPAVWILIGNGDGTFSQGSKYSLSGTAAESVYAADLNNDGNLDLILPDENRGLIVLLGKGDGTFQQFVEYPAPQQVIYAAIDDFNQDGALDVAASWVNGVCMFLGHGDGTFQPPVCFNVPSPDFFGIVAGDFNGDGKLDLVLTNDSHLLAVILGNGDGTFQQAQTYSLPSSATSPIAADFNGDGKLDLAIAIGANNSVMEFLGNGDGSFQNPIILSTAMGPGWLAVADMNGDGKLDLVVTDGGLDAAALSILLGNGDGTFQDYTSYDASLTSILAVADFNNDGKLDVAVTNANLNTITILTQDNGTVVKLSPSKLGFPIQLVGTVSNPKVISLSNTGSATLKISNISISPNFSQLNNCKTVQPGGSCRIGVFFTPTITGNLTGYMAITDTGGGSPQIVNLTGVATIVSISPTELNFGSWPVGHISTPMNVIVTNEGNGSMNINQIGIAGVNKQDFSEVNACPAKLQAGASCTITVIFHPSAAGVRSAILGIEDSGGGSPQRVPLTGTGT